jgi:ribonuclease H / adenosylcobalamin/alpha-ribazole phosphatase
MTWTPVRLRVCLFRHGETWHNREHRYSGRRDAVLTPEGEWTFRRWRDLVRHWPVSMIWTSPLPRAVACARILRGSDPIPLVWSSTLTEMDFGRWDGASWEEIPIVERETWRRWATDPWQYSPPGGETLADVARRLYPFWVLLQDPRHRGLWVVVSHLAPIKILLLWAMDAPPDRSFRLFLSPGSLSVIAFPEEGPPVVEAVNCPYEGSRGLPGLADADARPNPEHRS